jgi:hypothetical protein
VDGRVGKSDADACGFSVVPDFIDVVLGIAILPYCNVPGLKCAPRVSFGAKPLNRHYTKRVDFRPARPFSRVEREIAVLKMRIS